MLDQRLALDVVLMDSTNKSRDLEFFGVFREFSRSDDGGNFPLEITSSFSRARHIVMRYLTLRKKKND